LTMAAAEAMLVLQRADGAGEDHGEEDDALDGSKGEVLPQMCSNRSSRCEFLSICIC